MEHCAEASPDELIERARRGDARAFEQIIGPHLDSVRRFSYAFARDWVDADDLCQEALLKAFRSIHLYRDEAAFSTWLYSVTRSACFDWYKTRQSKHRLLACTLSPDLIDERNEQDSRLDTSLAAARTWAAIKRLKLTYRVPLVLFEIEGMSYQEIARVERIQVGTVRSRLARARAQLKRMLEVEEVRANSTLKAAELRTAELRTDLTPGTAALGAAR